MGYETPMTEVTVTIAINENGVTRCCIADTDWIQQQQEHSKFIQELREDRWLWTTKTVKVMVPIPVNYEDMTDK